jgi:hypothetical protein
MFVRKTEWEMHLMTGWLLVGLVVPAVVHGEVIRSTAHPRASFRLAGSWQ